LNSVRIGVASQSRQSVVFSGNITELNQYCHNKKTVIVTDARVRELYGSLFPPYPIVEIGRGEQSKTLLTAASVYEAFLEQGVDRSWLVVAVGGGIVCDVAGFVASTYLRGLPFGFVATTLLAQVDASIGGKNGVNLKGYKNQVGTFTQPDFVLCDFSVLRSLPQEELRNGFAEAIKHGLIADESLFDYLEDNVSEALSLEMEAVERAVYGSLTVKSAIVGRDETEKNERRKLNFGHTVGHALEKACGIRHGEAVSIGMSVAARLSSQRGLISTNDTGRIEHLLKEFGLPTRISADPEVVREALWKDKKRQNETIHVVLLDRIGQARVEPMGIEELDEAIDDLCQSC
jgi:3-dehydroquinate synthase